MGKGKTNTEILASPEWPGLIPTHAIKPHEWSTRLFIADRSCFLEQR
jgi:hypothetical protein